MILLTLTQSGPFSAALPAFIAMPVVITGIWGLRAGLAVLAIGVASFSVFAALDYKGLLSFPVIADFESSHTTLWATVIFFQ